MHSWNGRKPGDEGKEIDCSEFKLPLSCRKLIGFIKSPNPFVNITPVGEQCHQQIDQHAGRKPLERS